MQWVYTSQIQWVYNSQIQNRRPRPSQGRTADVLLLRYNRELRGGCLDDGDIHILCRATVTESVVPALGCVGIMPCMKQELCNGKRFTGRIIQ